MGFPYGHLQPSNYPPTGASGVGKGRVIAPGKMYCCQQIFPIAIKSSTHGINRLQYAKKKSKRRRASIEKGLYTS
jgi:hypothetical protein